MDQLQQAEKIAMQGELKDRALDACFKQLTKWGVAVPQGEPLPLDFGIGEFDRIGLIEFWIANEENAGYCGKYLFLFEGQACPTHSHRSKHETFFVVQGNIMLTVPGERHTLAAGGVLQISPGIIHGFSAVRGPALVLELSTPCRPDDNEFVEPEIQRWLTKQLA